MNNQTGRPSKIGDTDIDKLCEFISTGTTVSDACNRVGISTRTYHRWRLLGMQGEDEVFINFYYKVEQARAKGRTMLLEKVYAFADSDVRVAMWLLERSYPEDFSLNPYFRKTQKDFDKEFLKDEQDVIGNWLVPKEQRHLTDSQAQLEDKEDNQEFNDFLVVENWFCTDYKDKNNLSEEDLHKFSHDEIVDLFMKEFPEYELQERG